MSYFGDAGVLTDLDGGNNASTSNLLGDATFTGAWTLAARSHIFAMSKADVAGTLYFDFSNDGATLHSTYPVAGYSCSANIPEVHVAVTAYRYYRVRYVNGASAQSSFSLLISQLNLGTPLMASVNNAISLDSDAVVNRTGTDLFDISKGLVSGRANERKFGYNDAVGTTEEDLWFNGGVYNFLQSAATLRIKSGGNVNDTAAGTGAQSVTLIFLDSNWEEVTETLATAGASASSATSSTAIRLIRAYVENVGAYGAANTGSIVIETSGGTTVGNIEAARGQSQLGVYTVPASKVAYVYEWSAEVDSTKTANVFFNQRRNADDVTTPFQGKRLIDRYTGLSGVGRPRRLPYQSFPAKTDLWISGKTGSGTAGVNGAFLMIVEDA